MTAQVVLFHYGPFQPLWQRPGMIQCGPGLVAGETSLPVAVCEVRAIQQALTSRGRSTAAVLLHYTDPFLIRAAPLRSLRRWRGPRLLVCGDLHHGPAPIDTLEAYLDKEFHDAVLLAFNPMLLTEVQARLAVPVHCHPPGFFRYPRCHRHPQPARRLVHVGSLGSHHPQRRALVQALQERGRIPFLHCTTTSAEQAAELYAANSLVLNVPLNNDLNHRFYEVMAAGAPQIVFGSPVLLGPLQDLAHRSDLHWVEQVEELEALVQNLLASPERLQRPVEPPPELDLHQLLRRVFGASITHTLA